MPRIPAAAEADDFKPFVRPHSASGKYMMQLQDKTYVGLSSSDDWKVAAPCLLRSYLPCPLLSTIHCAFCAPVRSRSL